MIYFIRDTASGHIKIGFSKKPWARLVQCQVGCPTDLAMAAIIDGDEQAERDLHETYAKYHVRGEWFRCCGNLADFLNDRPPPARAVAAKKQSRKDFAALGGISEAYASQILTGRKSPKLAAAVRIYSRTGHLCGALAHATKHEADTLARIFARSQAAA